MKANYFTRFLMLATTACFINICTAQKISVSLKDGRTVDGNLISINVNEVLLDPEGLVTLLALNSTDISTLTFIKSNKTLNYPISEEQIPGEYKNKKYKPASINDNSSSKSLIGLKAGVNYSSWYGDGAGGTKGKPGFHVGAVFQFKLDDDFFFQPEIEYSGEGAKSDDKDNLQVNLDYLNIPLMFRRKTA